MEVTAYHVLYYVSDWQPRIGSTWSSCMIGTCSVSRYEHTNTISKKNKKGNDTTGCTQVILRHNRVLVQNQGTVLKKSSHRGVHPGHFPFREGENERRPISCAHSSWIKRSTLLCRKMTWVHPVVSVPQNETSKILLIRVHALKGLRTNLIECIFSENS